MQLIHSNGGQITIISHGPIVLIIEIMDEEWLENNWNFYGHKSIFSTSGTRRRNRSDLLLSRDFAQSIGAPKKSH